MSLWRVTVPATTSNLGPGFDALGMAVAIENTIVARPAPTLSITVSGEGAESLPRDERNLMVQAYLRGCGDVAHPPPALQFECHHAIPLARGLGSSAAAIIAGLLLANAVTRERLGRTRVLELATEMEGHPDNAAPALLGGLQASVTSDGKVLAVPVRPLVLPRVVLFVPSFEMKTADARAVLPPTLTRAEAVHNISRTALLVAALVAGDTSALHVATQDVLHQPARAKLFPAMFRIFAAAREAGALAAWLSGAGSTLATFTDASSAERVGAAMVARALGDGVVGHAIVTDVNTTGARCFEAEA